MLTNMSYLCFGVRLRLSPPLGLHQSHTLTSGPNRAFRRPLQQMT
jgi:hypothetical protein